MSWNFRRFDALVWRGAVVWVLTEISMLILLPFIYGRWVRGRRQQQVELQEFGAVQARETERTRIAREMHDVVAHRVSLMVLHAGALEIGARDERAVLTAGLIRTAGRQALTELRQVLGVLRGPAEREPLPSIADIPQIVGLIGISERLKVLDGRFHAGATPPGGFLVRAEIPLKAIGGTEHDPGADR